MQYIILTALMMCSLISKSQETYKSINRAEVEKTTTDTSSPKYYARLLSRFLTDDTTLTQEEFRLLYYGFVFQKEYTGYPDLQQRRINQEMANKNYDVVIKVCDSILSKIPINLVGNYYKGIALYNANNSDDTFSKYRNRFRKLLNAIISSGNGLTCETAFKTIFVSDEYQVIYKYFEIETFFGQSLQTPCDKMSVKPSRYFTQESMFFDTSETLIYMERLMKKK